VPAKTIRYRFEEEMIQDLLESQWWHKDIELIKAQSSLFHLPSDFTEALK
jgi:hypothetical protein